MNKEIISIIVPIYKAEKFLNNTLLSIKNQSYKNWECILVDDGSPDNSRLICEHFSKLDKRFKSFHKLNGGVTSARKFGLEKSTGKWITFVDSDDFLPHNALELLINENRKTESDIIIGAWEKQTNQSRRIIPLLINGIHNSRAIIRAFLYGRCYSGPVGKLYRRELFDENTFNIPMDIKLNEDLIMNIKLASRATSVICNSSIIVYRYIIRPNSASHSIHSNNWDLTFDVLHTALNGALELEYCHYVAMILHKYPGVKTSYKSYLENSTSYGYTDFYTKCVLNILNKNRIISNCYLRIYDFAKQIEKLPIFLHYYLKSNK